MAQCNQLTPLPFKGLTIRLQDQDKQTPMTEKLQLANHGW